MRPSRASLTVAGAVPWRKLCVMASVARGCSCPVCDPASTLLSPHKGGRVTASPVPE